MNLWGLETEMISPGIEFELKKFRSPVELLDLRWFYSLLDVSMLSIKGLPQSVMVVITEQRVPKKELWFADDNAIGFLFCSLVNF